MARESELLSHIYGRSAHLAAAFGSVLVGPGDDCAVVATPRGEQLLLKVDQLIEGRHFEAFPKTPVDLIARKAVARAVSDIAAMGGTPAWALAAATIPHGCPYADELFDAAARWARHWSCPLVGGDIASLGAGQAGPLLLGITIVGTPHAARGPVLRSGARPGDGAYVTGRLGGSFASERHLTFEPRLAEAARLCGALGADLHAMLDLSDGLGRDAARIAAASGVRIELEAALLPRHAGVTDWRGAAGDGEDYELLFTAAAAPPPLGTPVTRIGTVAAGSGCIIVDRGVVHDASNVGWDH